MIDEKSLRRPEFSEAESVPVEWPGIGTFYLPRPGFVFRRAGADAEGHSVVKMSTSFGPDFDRMIGQLETAKDDAETIAALFDIAGFMLSRNYALSDDRIGQFLAFDYAPGKPELPARWATVYKLARCLPIPAR